MKSPTFVGFFVSRHLGLVGCNIGLMKRFLPLLILTGLLSGQDVLLLKSGKNYKGRYITKENDVIIFRLEGEKNISMFSINDVDIIMRSDGDLYYPFDIETKIDDDVPEAPRILSYRPKSKIGQEIYARMVLGMCLSCAMLLAVLLAEATGSPPPGV